MNDKHHHIEKRDMESRLWDCECRTSHKLINPLKHTKT